MTCVKCSRPILDNLGVPDADGKGYYHPSCAPAEIPPGSKLKEAVQALLPPPQQFVCAICGNLPCNWWKDHQAEIEKKKMYGLRGL